MRNRLILSSCLLAATTAHAQTAFVNDASLQDFTHIYGGGWEHFVGGGVAAFDCNNDALPDLFMAGGENPATLARNTSAAGGPLMFAAESTGITGVTGAWPLDIDGDGILDLAVMRAGPNLLLKGGADCSFTPAPWSFAAEDRWSTAFTATWQGDGFPTLAVGNYVDRKNPDGPFEACDSNQLYRPNGAGYAEPVLLEPGFCPLSMLFSDPLHSGAPQLRVSNDRHYYVRGGHEQMWQITPELRELTAEDGWQAHMLWGMGIASRDLDGDAVAEVMLTSMGDQRLQLNTGGAGWVDAPFATGTASQRPYTGDDGRPSTGWHAEFGDVNNDGRDDLFMAKGNVDQMPDAATHDPNNLLLGQPDGTFTEVGMTAGIATMQRSRGAAVVDLNADGLLDIIVMNRRANIELQRNITTDAGNWLAIDLQQSGGNTRAVGAFIELQTADRTYWREITVGGGHGGGRAVPEHFGLGEYMSARARVHWPAGGISEWHDLPAGQVATFNR